MKSIYDELSFEVSKQTTKKYSTSFSLGILAIKPDIRNAIYAIYGYVRLADEIVDSFHDYDKTTLLNRFKDETFQAMAEGISLNPIIQAFQQTVCQYDLDHQLIEQFLYSMEMDLNPVHYDEDLFQSYIYGSAEVVGLMCLQVFTHKDRSLYRELKPYAQKLGSAFQKVNFLRDLKEDYETMGRTYFPNADLSNFDYACKSAIEKDIEAEFKEALIGIRMLPNSSRFGVYLAYSYYVSLFHKIKNTTAKNIINKRIRIPNGVKLMLTMKTYLRYKTALL